MKNNDQTIVYVSPYYPPHLGGLENVARAVAEEIARKGYETEVITTTSSGIRRG